MSTLIVDDVNTEPVIPSMRKIYINQLVDEIKYRRLPFTGDVYTLINKHNKYEAYKSIQAITLKAVRQFEASFPLSIETTLNIVNNTYVFMDNFQAYVDGKIDDTELELIPKVIHTVGGGPGELSQSANYFKYNPPYLWSGYSGKTRVKYFTQYPVYIKYAPDGGFTEDSFIWGVLEKRYLEDQFDLEFCRSVKQFSEQVRFAGISVEFLNLDTTIQKLVEDVEYNNNASSVILDAWE
jgi:hypothetical protein